MIEDIGAEVLNLYSVCFFLLIFSFVLTSHAHTIISFSYRIAIIDLVHSRCITRCQNYAEEKDLSRRFSQIFNADIQRKLDEGLEETFTRIDFSESYVCTPIMRSLNISRGGTRAHRGHRSPRKGIKLAPFRSPTQIIRHKSVPRANYEAGA